MKKTRVFFASYAKAEYVGAVRKTCPPDKAESWHCLVGGVQVAMTKETIGVHMPDMLRFAYEAGVNDTFKKVQNKLENFFYGEED